MIKLLNFLLLFLLASCSPSINKNIGSNKKYVSFNIQINRENYLKSIYGESPQIAVWLESVDKKKIRVVYVTHCAGKNDWIGKVNCDVALPFWNSQKLKYLNLNNKKLKQNIDAVSSATSKNDHIVTGVYLPENSVWKYFIEVNVAGDYNKSFNLYLKNGMPDTEGNGQPSLVYSGKINLTQNKVLPPRLIGRTHQTRNNGLLIKDTSTITTAKNIIKKIEIKIL